MVLALNFKLVGLALMALVAVVFTGFRFLSWSRFSYCVVDGLLDRRRAEPSPAGGPGHPDPAGGSAPQSDTGWLEW